MASAPTKGFTLQGIPAGPFIPKNIGQIDARLVYDGIKKGLDTFEAVRRAPASMALADATLASETAQQPLAARAALAQTEGIEQQTPLNTAILAERASPERMALERAALTQKGQPRPLTGLPYLLGRVEELRRDVAANPTDAVALAALADAQGALNKVQQTTATDPNAAIRSRETIAADTNASREQIAADNAAAANARADADRASREGIARAGNLSREQVAASQGLVRAQIQADKTGTAKQKLATAAKARLDAIDSRTQIVEKALAEAIPQIGLLTAGPGVVLSSIPGTPAKNVRRLLDTVKANIGFEELNNLRAQSPTGGALGNVTEQELKFLQSVLGSMEQDQSPSQLRENLQNILQRFRELRQEKQEAFQADFGTPAVSTLAPAQIAPIAPQSTPNAVPAAVASGTATPKTYSTVEEVEIAGANGDIAVGEEIIVNGRKARWTP